MSATAHYGENSSVITTVVVVAGIAAVGYADWLVTANASLGFLYAIPLAVSGSVHRLRTSVGLVFVCVLLRQWLGPFEEFEWHLLARSVVFLGTFLALVVFVHRWAEKRRQMQRAIQERNALLIDELDAAARIQRRLLAHASTQNPRLDVATWMLPSRQVGGDYYDLIETAGGRLDVVIGDVSGKGLPAAMLMPAIWIALRILIPLHSSPGQGMRTLNNLLYAVSDSSRFVTLFHASIDLSEKRLIYSNAGHFQPLLIPANGASTRWLDVGGTVVGLFPDVEHETDEVELQSGDVLILYTDGLVELENAEGRQFDRDYLKDVSLPHASQTAQEILNRIRSAAEKFGGGETFQDDVTLIVVRVPPGRDLGFDVD